MERVVEARALIARSAEPLSVFDVYTTVYAARRPDRALSAIRRGRPRTGRRYHEVAALCLRATLRATPCALRSPLYKPSLECSAPAEALEALRSLPVSIGIVQTAYANGASTDYMRGALALPTAIAKTGVKFVHAAAAAYDIGVYFEANGHGTVLFHPAFLARLETAVDGHAERGALGAALGSAAAAAALARLLAVSRVVNQAVGDALSDALLIEAVLTLKGWSVRDWDALYEDLPSRQAKLAVPDRAAFVPVADETRLAAPADVQAAVDARVAATPRGRAFVRPSGTEDVVRFYAEAATQDAADALCAQLVDDVRRIVAGGGGQ